MSTALFGRPLGSGPKKEQQLSKRNCGVALMKTVCSFLFSMMTMKTMIMMMEDDHEREMGQRKEEGGKIELCNNSGHLTRVDEIEKGDVCEFERGDKERNK